MRSILLDMKRAFLSTLLILSLCIAILSIPAMPVDKHTDAGCHSAPLSMALLCPRTLTAILEQKTAHWRTISSFVPTNDLFLLLAFFLASVAPLYGFVQKQKSPPGLLQGKRYREIPIYTLSIRRWLARHQLHPMRTSNNSLVVASLY